MFDMGKEFLVENKKTGEEECAGVLDEAFYEPSDFREINCIDSDSYKFKVVPSKGNGVVFVDCIGDDHNRFKFGCVLIITCIKE